MCPNQPPVLLPIGPKTRQIADIGTLGALISVASSDPEDDVGSIVYSVTSPQPIIEQGTFHIGSDDNWWYMPPSNLTPGDWDVTVTVTDPGGFTDSETFQLTVEGPVAQCFIATAAYGTPFDRDIDVLRDFRDKQLLNNRAGQDFVELYYQSAPPIADKIVDNKYLQSAVRSVLKPVVEASRWWLDEKEK